MNMNLFVRWITIVAGLLSLGLGVIGIFVPVLPTTPFLLLSAGCFVRSSSRLHSWLMGHKILGPYIKQYIVYRAVTMKTKITAVSLIWCSILLSSWIVSKWMVTIILLIIASSVTVYLFTLKTLDPAMLKSDSPTE